MKLKIIFTDKGDKSTISGFTIVELLVVIVVIGILAAITIVSYTGISNKANVAALQSDLDNSSKQLKLYYTLYSSYPTAVNANNCPTAPTADNNYCLKATTGGSYQYQASSSTFCITETKSNTSYYIDQNGQPMTGGCSGDWVAGVGAITNMIVNPSAESGVSAPNVGYYSPTITVDSTQYVFGTHSIKLVTNNAIDYQGLVWGATGASPNTTYTCSVYIKGTNGISINVAGRAENGSDNYIGEGYGSNDITLSASWQRVSATFTSPANTAYIDIQYHINNLQSGVSIWGDGAICTQGSTLYNYADGNSRNWVWNGTANSSTSTGPAI